MQIKQNKLNKYLLLSLGKLWLLVISGFIFVLLHNFISAIFDFEEALFFIMVIFLLPFYLIVAGIYSLINFFQKKKKISWKFVSSILIGLIGGGILSYFRYFIGPWFFGLFFLLITLVVYSLLTYMFRD